MTVTAIVGANWGDEGKGKMTDYLAGQEKEYISVVLNACKDDKALAARILKCDPAKLE